MLRRLKETRREKGFSHSRRGSADGSWPFRCGFIDANLPNRPLEMLSALLHAGLRSILLSRCASEISHGFFEAAGPFGAQRPIPTSRISSTSLLLILDDDDEDFCLPLASTDP